jgi:endonuclease-3
MKAVPKRFQQHAHHWLILHGRYRCKARKPDCPDCPIRDLCAWKEKT